MRLYKRTFKARSPAEVHDEVGKGGGVIVRIDQDGDSTTAYFEADDQTGRSTDAKEATLAEVKKI